MEIIIPFYKNDFTDDGTHLPTEKFIIVLQRDWEENFHNQFNPYYANVLEGHPKAMLRLTKSMEAGEASNYDFGMELINGEIDIDTNLEIERYSELSTVYAIGSQYHDDEDSPLLLIKNESLQEDILVLKYVPDDDEVEEIDTIPVESTSVLSRK